MMLFELVPTGHEQEDAQILERVRKGQPVAHFETVRRRKGGQEISLSIKSSRRRAGTSPCARHPKARPGSGSKLPTPGSASQPQTADASFASSNSSMPAAARRVPAPAKPRPPTHRLGQSPQPQGTRARADEAGKAGGH
jgi:hypothetical protein